MAYRTPLSLPNDKIYSIKLAPVSVTGSSVSEFTFAHQTFVWVGYWAAEVQVADMARADAVEWQAFLARLNGAEGTFLLGDPLGSTPRGAGAGAFTPYLSGGALAGNSLLSTGWPVSTAILKRGDYVQFGSGPDARLHMVLDDVSSDVSGNATLTVWPSLREPRVSGSERMTNGSFDSITGWTRTQTGGTISLDTTTKTEGAASFAFARTAATTLTAVQSYTAASSFLPRERYRLQFQAQRNAAGTGNVCLVKFRNTTRNLEVEADGVTWSASANLISTSLSTSWAWKRASIRIREDFSPDDDYSVTFEHGNTSNNSTVWYDNASINGPTNDGVRVYTASPVGVFRLAGNVSGWTEKPPAKYTSIAFEAVEAL